MELTDNNGKAFAFQHDNIMHYVEPFTPGMDRRIFRYENNNIGAYIEWCYFNEYKNCHRARWYGYANRTMPDFVGEL